MWKISYLGSRSLSLSLSNDSLSLSLSITFLSFRDWPSRSKSPSFFPIDDDLSSSKWYYHSTYCFLLCIYLIFFFFFFFFCCCLFFVFVFWSARLWLWISIILSFWMLVWGEFKTIAGYLDYKFLIAGVLWVFYIDHFGNWVLVFFPWFLFVGLSNYWFRCVVIIVLCISHIISSETLYCNLFLRFCSCRIEQVFWILWAIIILWIWNNTLSSLRVSFTGCIYKKKLTTFLIGDRVPQKSIL